MPTDLHESFIGRVRTNITLQLDAIRRGTEIRSRLDAILNGKTCEDRKLKVFQIVEMLCNDFVQVFQGVSRDYVEPRDLRS